MYCPMSAYVTSVMVRSLLLLMFCPFLSHTSCVSLLKVQEKVVSDPGVTVALLGGLTKINTSE